MVGLQQSVQVGQPEAFAVLLRGADGSFLPGYVHPSRGALHF